MILKIFFKLINISFSNKLINFIKNHCLLDILTKYIENFYRTSKNRNTL